MKTYKIKENSGSGHVGLLTDKLLGCLQAIAIKTHSVCEIIIWQEDFQKNILKEIVNTNKVFYPKTLVCNNKGGVIVPEKVTKIVLFGKLQIQYKGLPNQSIEIEIIYGENNGE